MSNCPICSTDATIYPLAAGADGKRIVCPRCGEFRVSSTAEAMLPGKLAVDIRKMANASGWVREHQKELISSDTVSLLEQLPTPSIPDKGLSLLKYLEKKTNYPGERIILASTINGTLEFYAVARAVNHEEYAYIYKFIEKLGYIDGAQITPDGFAYLDKAKYSNTDSQIGFCAMWFDASVTTIWSNAISPAILDAGYEPKRIDEHPHNNRIDDEIIALIRRSKFVVADFTGQRGGVYFEAGFALGMNLPVIWTIKKSDLSSVHFDNRQYNFVTWEEDKLAEFKLNLQYRIEATLGRGSWKPSA